MIEILRALLGLNWNRFTWGIYNWFTSPAKVTLTLVLLSGFLLLVSPLRIKRQVARGAVVLLGAYWFMISPLFSVPAIQLLVNFVPADTGQSADAVVVLARKKQIEGERYRTAVSLLESGRVPTIFTLGRDQSMRTYKLLQEKNFPTEDTLFGIGCVRTTKQEAYSVASFLGPRNINRIILVTDSPHMLRSWLTFKSLGFSVIPHIEPLPETLGHDERTFLAIREYFGLLSYALLGRFKPPAQPLGQLAKELAEDFPPDRCGYPSARIREWLVQS